MKKLIIVLGLVIIVLNCTAQTVLTPKPLMNMNVDNTFHLNDWFYTMDQGVGSKRISGNTFMEAVSDSLIARWQRTVDSLAALRLDIGGGGYFSRTGRRLTVTNVLDSLGVGGVPSYKLDVTGNSRVYGDFHVNHVLLDAVGGGTGDIYSIGDDLYLKDANNPSGKTLSSLIEGGPFSRTFTAGLSSTTLTSYSTSTSLNWHLGGSTATTRKLKVTGDAEVTGNLYMGNYIDFKGVGSLYGTGHPQVGMEGDSLVLSDATGTYYLNDLVSGGGGLSNTDTVRYGPYAYAKGYSNYEIEFGSDYPGGGRLNINTGIPGINDGVVGNNDIALTSTAIEFTHGAGMYAFDGTYWRSNTDTLATNAYSRAHGTGGEGGTGNMVAVGTPAAGQIGVWASASTMLGYPAWLYTGTTKTAGAWYSGTNNPSNRTRMNYNGMLYASGASIGRIGIGDTTVFPALYKYTANIHGNKYESNTKIGLAGGLRIQSTADTSFAVKKTGGTNIFTVVGDSVYLKQYTGESNILLTVTSTGAIKRANPPISIVYTATDTIAASSGSTPYQYPITSALDGYTLIGAELYYANSQGDRVPTVTVWRNRGGVEANMTSVGANFTTDADINEANDDVIRGDRIKLVWTLGTGTTAPYGLLVNLTFQKL
jgi:hypothetical protein